MNQLSGRQRALLDFLVAYHGDGFTPADVMALPEDAQPDLDALMECGLVEIRFTPQPPATPETIEAEIAADPAPVPAKRRNTGKRVRSVAKPQAVKTPPSMPAPRKAAGAATVWDEGGKARFLAALAETGNVSKSEAAIGAGRNSAHYHRSRDPVFRAGWGKAVEAHGGDRIPVETPATPPAPVAAPPTPAPPQAPRRRASDAEIAAQALARNEEARRIEALRPPMDAEEAKLILQRKGRVVHRANVTGGRADRWIVSGFAEEIDSAMLIAEAKRVEAQGRR